MSSRTINLRTLLLLLIAGLLVSLSAFAGSAVIGSVAGSVNSTLGGQAVQPNTLVFSGDKLQVKDGATVVALKDGTRLVFGKDTVASFQFAADAVSVLLDQGSISLYQATTKTPLHIKVNDVSITPVNGFKTWGQVASLNGAITVTSKEGKLRVEGNGPASEVPKGQTITIAPKTARAPQTGGSQKLGGGNALDIAAVAAGGTAAVLAGIGISKAKDARDAADAANSTAAAAESAAAAAGSTAALADSDAIVAAMTANHAGCALDVLVEEEGLAIPSPYIPPSGFTCP